MANSNGKISAPVDLEADVCKVLGLTRIDTGYVCANSHGHIRPWAKYKPVEAPVPEWDLRKRWEQRQVDGVLRWVQTATGGIAGYQGAAGDCGLSAAVVNAPNLAGSASAAWRYTPPSTFYRLSDFDGYNHRAQPPYNGISVTGVIAVTVTEDNAATAVKVYSGQTVTFGLRATTGDDSVLRLRDISLPEMTGSDSPTLESAWAGLVVYTAAACEAKDYLCFFTADSNAGMVPVSWEMPSRSTGSSLWVVPVLARNRQRYKNDDGTLAALVANSLVRVPGVPVVKLTYTTRQEAEGLELTLTAKELAPVISDGGTSGTSMVSVTLTVKATGRAYTGGGYFTLHYGSGRETKTIEEFTVKAGEKHTVIAMFDTTGRNGNITVDVNLDGGYSKTGVVPMKPAARGTDT